MYKFLNRWMTFIIDMSVIGIGMVCIIGSHINNTTTGLGLGIIFMVTGFAMLLIDINGLNK